MAMKIEDKINKLPHTIRRRVIRAVDFVPRLSRGHGSLKAGQCNAKDCKGGQFHFQNGLEAAYKILEPVLK